MARCKKGGTHSGRTPSGNRKYEIQRIQDWHREVMRLIVLGWKNTQLAEYFGCSEEQICTIRNSSIVRQQVGIMQSVRDGKVLTPKAKLKSMVMPGLEILDDMMRSEKTPLHLKKDIIFGVADRTGLGPTSKVQSVHEVVFMRKDQDELERRKQAAIDEGIIVAEVIEEAEVKEVV